MGDPHKMSLAEGARRGDAPKNFKKGPEGTCGKPNGNPPEGILTARKKGSQEKRGNPTIGKGGPN